jgi:uncharacterized coiled-coil DUF342 family protein
MTQESIANSLHKQTLNLAEKWSETYSKTNVESRFMAEDLFAFINVLLNNVEGFENEVASLRDSIAEQQTELVELRQERDDLIDNNNYIHAEAQKLRTERFHLHHILQALKHVIEIKS